MTPPYRHLLLTSQRADGLAGPTSEDEGTLPVSKRSELRRVSEDVAAFLPSRGPWLCPLQGLNPSPWGGELGLGSRAPAQL